MDKSHFLKKNAQKGSKKLEAIVVFQSRLEVWPAGIVHCVESVEV